MKREKIKRYFCFRSSLVRRCRGIETERIRDIVEASTKKEAKEKFKNRHNRKCAQVCIEITEPEEELGYQEALQKYDS